MLNKNIFANINKFSPATVLEKRQTLNFIFRIYFLHYNVINNVNNSIKCFLLRNFLKLRELSIDDINAMHIGRHSKCWPILLVPVVSSPIIVVFQLFRHVCAT